jgi:DNA-binding GntR family transcriptional regulator
MYFGGNMGKKIEKLSRYIELHTDEELEAFKDDLLLESIRRDKGVVDEESWLDEEFNRIFVTYAYPDVTKVM